MLSDRGDVQGRTGMYLRKLLECWLSKPISLEQADAVCLQNQELRLSLDPSASTVMLSFLAMPRMPATTA